MSRGTDPEDLAALAVLDALGRLDNPEDTSVPEPEDEIDAVLRKLHGDAIAMMAYALEPVVPSSTLRSSIFGLTVGDSTQEVEPLRADEIDVAPFGEDSGPTLSVPAPGLFEAMTPVEPDAPRAAASAPAPMASVAAISAGTRSAAPFVLPPADPAPRRTGRGRWMALAAILAFVLVGAGFWIAYLHSELAAQSARLAWAEREWKSEVTAVREQSKSFERRLSLVTSPAVTVFHLRCPSGSGPGATANANVYVSSDQRRWELEVQGLASEPEGREYQIWFLVGDEMKSGGCFTMQDGEVALLNPASFPPGTTGVAISLEPKGGSRVPTTAPILVSTEPVRL